MISLNLFYEKYPSTIRVHEKWIPIITDFREYIRLFDMLRCDELKSREKVFIIQEYFLEDITIDADAIMALSDFILMLDPADEQYSEEIETPRKKNLFSYTIDYPYILSGFLRDYVIDLETIEYLHWWKFRALFDGLSDDTEIKQRIMYRGIDLSTVKDKEEKKRIARIQRAIRLPAEQLSDYDIGNVFA